jgi:hypothetical protein
VAVSRPKSVSRSSLRVGIEPVGAFDGVNVTFFLPESFVHDPPRQTLTLFYNGQRLSHGHDYLVSEGGGPGGGYDTLTTLFAPRPGDRLQADYTANGV